MEINLYTAMLIGDLEQLVGEQRVYTPQNIRKRYPVRVTYQGKECEYNGSALCLDQECVDTMFYKFGWNELYIGTAIQNILETLEKRYGLDFNELEQERIRQGRIKLGWETD